MDNYDRKITCATLNPNTIKQINDIKLKNPHEKIIVEIHNSKGTSSESLKMLHPDIPIRIAGAYDRERVARFGNIKYTNGETGEYFTNAVIYSRNEAIKIIQEMEKIERGFKGQNLTQLEKTIYIYEKLKSSIMYDPKFENKPSSEIRSLRGLITNKSVCAGYALIFKEMLDRQGIKCHYVSGKSGGGGHAWNIVSVDGKNYPIDLTWDNSRFRSGQSKTTDFFGKNVKKFEETHIPAEGELCKDYVLSELDPKLVEKIRSRFSREKYYQSTTYTGRRKDGSRYMLSQVGDNIINKEQYYRYYYADIDKNGKLLNPAILYSETNVAHFIDAVQFNETKGMPEGYEEALDNVLFSRENIANSQLKRNWLYR